MAKVNFNELNAVSTTTTANDRDFPVKFFKLNNGEDAIVRILVDSADDFDIRTVHRVTMDGYQYGKNVNCIMDGGNPMTCPLCASGSKVDQRLFIRMIKYSVENGVVVATPVVWERSVYDKTFGTQALVNCIRDYGALSDILCRISRSGEKLNTVYTATFGLNIMPNTRSVYRDELYPKNVTLFGDFDVLGVSILDKNYDELSQFVQTGAFPLRASNNTASDASGAYPAGAPTVSPNTAAHSYGAPNTYVPQSAPTIDNPTISVATPRPAPQWGSAPSAGSDGGFARPRRL